MVVCTPVELGLAGRWHSLGPITPKRPAVTSPIIRAGAPAHLRSAEPRERR